MNEEILTILANLAGDVESVNRRIGVLERQVAELQRQMRAAAMTGRVTRRVAEIERQRRHE